MIETDLGKQETALRIIQNRVHYGNAKMVAIVTKRSKGEGHQMLQMMECLRYTSVAWGCYFEAAGYSEINTESKQLTNLAVFIL